MASSYSYSLAGYDPTQLTAEVAALALPGYLYLSGGAVGSADFALLFSAALSSPQKAALDAAVQAHVPLSAAQKARAAAKALAAAATGDVPDALRAIVAVTIDELNVLRERLAAQDAAVAAAASLADLKSRWAAVATAQPVLDRTRAQALAALAAKLDAGGGDV